MKKNIAVVFLILFLCLVGFFFFMKKANRTSELIERVENRETSASNEKSLQGFAKKSQAPQNIEANTNLGDPKSCQDAWRELSRMDTNLWGSFEGKSLDATFVFADKNKLNQFRDKFNYSSRCQLGNNHPLWPINEEVKNACYSEKNQNQNNDGVLNCMAALMKLRFESIDYQTKSQAIDQIQDIGLIGAKLFSHILSSQPEKKLDEFIALSRRALELEPDNISAAEYWVQGSYMKLLQADEKQNVEELEKAFEHLRKAAPQSDLVFEAQMAIARQKGDFSEIERLSNNARDSGRPTESADYQMAWASYLEGREEDSESYLEKILEKNPGNSRAQSSLELLRKSRTLSKELKEKAPPFFTDLGSLQYGFTLNPSKTE